MKIKRIDHLVVTTNHLEDCLKFYQALGFEVREAGPRYELFCGAFKINVHLEGRELEPRARRVTPGSQDLCLEVADDLDVVLRELKDAGIPVELEISRRHGFHGEMFSIYLRDPDGNLVELCQYGKE